MYIWRDKKKIDNPHNCTQNPINSSPNPITITTATAQTPTTELTFCKTKFRVLRLNNSWSGFGTECCISSKYPHLSCKFSLVTFYFFIYWHLRRRKTLKNYTYFVLNNITKKIINKIFSRRKIFENLFLSFEEKNILLIFCFGFLWNCCFRLTSQFSFRQKRYPSFYCWHF